MSHALATFEERISLGLAPLTIEFYTQNVKAALRIMESAGCEVLPHKIAERDVHMFIAEMKKRDYSANTIHDYVSAVRKYTEAWGNYTIAGMKIRLPQDLRPNVDWLTKAQARELLKYVHTKGTPIQLFTVHMELCLGLRRVEVLRMRVEDIDFENRCITVRGKADRVRAVPFAFDTDRVLSVMLGYRETQVHGMVTRYPSRTDQVPHEVVLWGRKNILHPYTLDGYGLDKIVCEQLQKPLGFKPKNHTLRRTFGRTLWLSDVPVETIAKILGHRSTEQTLRYIGVSMDDMRAVMGRNIYE